MELYVEVSFYLGCLGLFINLLCILSVDYPRTKKETIGEKLFAVLVGAGFVAWAGFLNFS
jgi:hypothetical protein